jgi:hypothetical protein
MRPSNPPGSVALCKNLDSVAMAPQLLEEIRKRRVGGKLAAPAVSPLAARAQQRPAMQVIGFLNGTAFSEVYLPSFQKGLSEAGYSRGQERRD